MARTERFDCCSLAFFIYLHSNVFWQDMLTITCYFLCLLYSDSCHKVTSWLCSRVLFRTHLPLVLKCVPIVILPLFYAKCICVMHFCKRGCTMKTSSQECVFCAVMCSHTTPIYCFDWSLCSNMMYICVLCDRCHIWGNLDRHKWHRHGATVGLWLWRIRNKTPYCCSLAAVGQEWKSIASIADKCGQQC